MKPASSRTAVLFLLALTSATPLGAVSSLGELILHVNKLEQRQDFKELAAVYREEAELRSKMGHRAAEVEALVQLQTFLTLHLKEYSQALETGKRALALVEEARREGPDHEPDAHFHERAMTTFLQPTSRKEMGDRYVALQKQAFYDRQYQMILTFLVSAYQAVGDTREAGRVSQQLKALDQPESLKQRTERDRELGRMAEETSRTRHEKKAKQLSAQAEVMAGSPHRSSPAVEQLRKLAELEQKAAQSSTMAIGEAQSQVSVRHAERLEELSDRMEHCRTRGLSRELKEAFAEYLRLEQASEQEAKAIVAPMLRQADAARSGMLPLAGIDLLEKVAGTVTRVEMALSFGLDEEALSLAQEGLALAEVYEKGRSQPQAPPNIPGLPKEMLESLEKMQALPEMLETRNLLTQAGVALFRMGRHKEAAEFLERALKAKEPPPLIVTPDVPEPSYLDPEEELIRVRLALGHGERAVKLLGARIARSETLLSRLTRESHRIGFLELQSRDYDRIIRLLMEQDRVEEAFSYAERARGRVLVDLLATRPPKPRDPKSGQLLKQKRDLDQKLEELQTPDSGQPPMLDREQSLRATLEKRAEVVHKLRSQDPELASLVTVDTATAKETRERMDGDTALVSYYVDGEGVDIWAMTRDHLIAKRVEVPLPVLVAKVDALRRQASVPPEAKDAPPPSPASATLSITPDHYRAGENAVLRLAIDNPGEMYLSIQEIRTGDRNEPYHGNLRTREVTPGNRAVVLEEPIGQGIDPGSIQLLLRTDQGELVTNRLEITLQGKDQARVADHGRPKEARPLSSGKDAWEKATLYDLLLAPVADSLKGKRLGIVPHGVLHHLPFAALRNGQGKYLVENQALFTLPSATVLRYISDKGHDPRGESLVLGNPDLGNPDWDLPFAGEEADAVSRLLSSPRVLKRGEAREASFKSLAGKARVLHLASHGEFDARQPLDSALLLASGQGEDGRLTMGEIFDLNLQAGLVVLSACQSGMSWVRAGGETMGLPRAFFYAGAPSVVASQWSVSDEATALLMIEFYKNLNAGLGKAQALQSAQLKLLGDEKTGHPYFWAPFHLVGDYR